MSPSMADLPVVHMCFRLKFLELVLLTWLLRAYTILVALLISVIGCAVLQALLLALSLLKHSGPCAKKGVEFRQ
jgi:hypothetical protein